MPDVMLTDGFGMKQSASGDSQQVYLIMEKMSGNVTASTHNVLGHLSLVGSSTMRRLHPARRVPMTEVLAARCYRMRFVVPLFYFLNLL